MEYVKLQNGAQMPLEGFGVFQIPDPGECERAVSEAIDVGYRLLDTAAVYKNEEAVGAAVGKAIADGKAAREDFFITTKLWWSDASYDRAKAAAEASMRKLGVDYLDLYLIHQPYGDIYGAWKAMEEMQAAGTIRAIGVANFSLVKLMEFASIVETAPMVNQIELHPFFAQPDAIQSMEEYGCVPQAWAPLAEGKHNIFTHPVLTKIGDRYGKTAAQVALRWNIQRGVSIIPKSVHRERMEQNFNIWDFTLSEADMQAIAALDLGHSDIIDHNNPEVLKFILSTKIDD